jgi:ATP-dependent protease ClpP protease subunit
MKYLLALYLLISSTHALGKTLNVMDTPKNLILYLSGAIAESTVNPLINSLDHISSNNVPKRVIILIDTVGGEIVEGHHLIAAMNIATARNTAIDCIVGRKAYSMGAMLLPHCSKVYALKHSVIMFHSIRMHTLSPVTVSFLSQSLFSVKILGEEYPRISMNG